MFTPLPYLPLFIFFLLLGPIISMSSPNWFIMWFGLEMNLLAFIPIITASKSFQETEAATKYFLTQASAGLILLLSLLYTSPLSSFFVLLSLTLKLGAAPLHFWLPSVTNSMPWFQIAILMTWQKAAPLMMISYMIHSSFNFLIPIALASALVGSLMGMNQSQLRTLIAYSSISHLGWMLIISLVTPFMSLLYFITYITITMSIILLLSLNNHLTLSSLYFNSSSNLIFLFPLLLSLAGLPPLTGFAPKSLIVFLLANSNLFIPATLLLISSLMSLYFYLTIAMTCLPSSLFPSNYLYTPTSVLPSTLIMLSLFSLPLFFSPLPY